jgi:hypothetical protein
MHHCDTIFSHLDLLAAADATRRLEQAIDERLVLLSQFVVRANPELLPAPRQFVTPSTRDPLADVDADELAQLTGLSPQDVAGLVREERQVARQALALRNEALALDGRRIEATLERALQEVATPDEDISPGLARTPHPRRRRARC